MIYNKSKANKYLINETYANEAPNFFPNQSLCLLFPGPSFCLPSGRREERLKSQLVSLFRMILQKQSCHFGDQLLIWCNMQATAMW